MNSALPLKEKVETIHGKKADANVERAPVRPNILVATIDPDIRGGLVDLFQSFSLNTIWLKGVEAAKKAIAREKLSACLCGFWLQDGTYRELVRHIRRERMEIPVIIVSAPGCPQEYGDYLSALRIGALDFLCHPYRKGEFERMLRMAIGEHTRSLTQQGAAIGSEFRTGEAA